MAVTNPHPWTDDDGSGTTGTVISNAALQNIYNDLGPETATTTLTGVQTALPIPSGVGPLVIYCNNASLLSIKGIAAGIDGQLLTLISMGAGQVDLYHQDVNATAANRLINFATSGQTSLAAGSGTAVLQYDATTARWRLVAHEQGAWITAAFNSANFTASSGNWTVASGDVAVLRYRLSGRTLLVNIGINTSAVSATPVALRVLNGAYGGFTHAAFEHQLLAARIADNSAAYSATPGLLHAAASDTKINIYKDGSTTATFTTTGGADLTSVYGMISFEVI